MTTNAKCPTVIASKLVFFGSMVCALMLVEMGADRFGHTYGAGSVVHGKAIAVSCSEVPAPGAAEAYQQQFDTLVRAPLAVSLATYDQSLAAGTPAQFSDSVTALANDITAYTSTMTSTLYSCYTNGAASAVRQSGLSYVAVLNQLAVPGGAGLADVLQQEATLRAQYLAAVDEYSRELPDATSAESKSTA